MRPLITGALSVLLLAACSSGTSSRPDAGLSTAPSAAERVSPAPNGLAVYYNQRLRWAPCREGFTCATLRVPLDYRRPADGDISVAVIRLPASGRRLGSLLINPGGPGSSGVDYARAATSVLSSALRYRFDAVGFDPRGVGLSTPLKCADDRQLDALLQAPTAPRNAAETADTVRAAHGLASGCRSRAARLLPHVGTLDVARDLDVLRAALGDAELTYLGKSYGTLLGAKYAELFPRRVRALALDGALDPTLGINALNAGQAAGFEANLREFLRACGTAGACGASPADASARLDRLLARIAGTPLPAPSAPGNRRLTVGEATFGLAGGLYSRASWPMLAVAVLAAEAGDGSGLLQLSDQLAERDRNGHFSNQLEINNAVNCLDRPATRGLAGYAQQAAALRLVAPRFGPTLGWGNLACAYWPVPPTDRPGPVRAPGAPPILVVGTTNDPATPYAWAVGLSRQLPGVLLTYDAFGHTAYRRGSECVDRAVDAYLISLQLPTAGTRCS
jgi:pimeloyl-ACP methyl ester carboxylesterase